MKKNVSFSPWSWRCSSRRAGKNKRVTIPLSDGEDFASQFTVGYPQRLLRNGGSRGICETCLPRQRTNHQSPGCRGTAGKEGATDCRHRPTRHLPAICSRQSCLRNSCRTSERNKRLLGRQAISVQEYEISVANYQKAKSAYELSGNNMRDTRLTAPFEGSIEKRLVENYQRVNAGEGVVLLVNTQKLRVKFTVPDDYLYLLRAKDVKFKVVFDSYPAEAFDARMEEYLDISTAGTGIPVTITIDDPHFDRARYDVKPGIHMQNKAGIGCHSLPGRKADECTVKCRIR